MDTNFLKCADLHCRFIMEGHTHDMCMQCLGLWHAQATINSLSDSCHCDGLRLKVLCSRHALFLGKERLFIQPTVCTGWALNWKLHLNIRHFSSETVLVTYLTLVPWTYSPTLRQCFLRNGKSEVRWHKHVPNEAFMTYFSEAWHILIVSVMQCLVPYSGKQGYIRNNNDFTTMSFSLMLKLNLQYTYTAIWTVPQEQPHSKIVLLSPILAKSCEQAAKIIQDSR